MTPAATRRHFLRSAFRSLTAGSLAAAAWRGIPLAAAEPRLDIKKAVKFSMIKDGKNVEEKFALVKSLGFAGVEIHSPGDLNVAEVVAARDKTGIVIHGVIDSIHWKIRLSDPDPEVRAKGLAALRGALRDAKTYGATTVLLVPGKVTNPETENYDQVYSRSQEEIRKAIPDAESLGVKIAIEVVWNNFITTPQQLVQYVDDFRNPIVGAYFDVSNMIKFGAPPADWIRALGKRMLKFDFKGYSNKNGWVAIGEGDENWPEVRRALAEVDYHGWATAEVKAGGADWLRDVGRRMDECLGTG